MADSHKKPPSRGESRPLSSRERGARPKSTNLMKDTNKNLLSREEEYKRLNAELEKKTANLVKEAEAVINQQDSAVNTRLEQSPSASLLKNISTDDLYDDWDGDGLASSTQIVNARKPPYGKAPSAPTRRPQKSSNAVSRSKTSLAASDNILTEFNDLQSAVDEIESKMSVTDSTDVPDDIMPSAAQEMGSDAQIRFLKAKARVMQEEMERLAAELAGEKEENNKSTSRIRDLEEERNKLARSNATLQTQVDKVKKSSDDHRNKSEQLESQISALKKELDEVKRSQKQQLATQSAADVRLNRALEEVEKYKLQLGKVKEQTRSTSDNDKQKIERLLADNKRLEKQKGELVSGFKKQLKLIDILKRQKMHIEAAKMLSFTEEEFVKALEWGD